MISERMGFFDCDNLLNYNAGPLKVTISGWEETILVKSPSPQWDHLLPSFLECAKLAWRLNDNDITFSTNEIKINLTYESLKLYIEHTIVFR
jgi:hypothetical protein